MLKILSIEPKDSIDSNCCWTSFKVSLPASRFFWVFSKAEESVTLWIFCINDSKSPIPKRRERNDSGLNSSKSWGFSPVPMKTTGTFVSAQAVRAPPAFAVESILVIITPVIETADLNV